MTKGPKKMKRKKEEGDEEDGSDGDGDDDDDGAGKAPKSQKHKKTKVTVRFQPFSRCLSPSLAAACLTVVAQLNLQLDPVPTFPRDGPA